MPASLLKTGARGKPKAQGSNGGSSRVKMRGRSSPGGVGMEGGEKWSEGGKVWKHTDRTGYAQTGSRSQAQT